jgi:hypothetical protein
MPMLMMLCSSFSYSNTRGVTGRARHRSIRLGQTRGTPTSGSATRGAGTARARRGRARRCLAAWAPACARGSAASGWLTRERENGGKERESGRERSEGERRRQEIEIRGEKVGVVEGGGGWDFPGRARDIGLGFGVLGPKVGRLGGFSIFLIPKYLFKELKNS